MEVGMVKQVLPPRVKDGKETNLRSKMFGIGGNSQHRVGRGSEEDAIDDALVLQGNVGNLFRHGKDDMKVLGLEKFRLPVFNPLGAGQRLTFRTVTIPNRSCTRRVGGRSGHTLRRGRPERRCGTIQWLSSRAAVLRIGRRQTSDDKPRRSGETRPLLPASDDPTTWPTVILLAVGTL